MATSGSSVTFNTLREVGCCKRCCLRFMGERTVEAYQNVEDWLLKHKLEISSDTSQHCKMLKSNPCIVCLGLLQEIAVEDTVKKIASSVCSKPYDCKKFSCALSLPIAIQLREYSLWCFVVDNFPLYQSGDELQENAVTSIKDVWKWTIGPCVAEAISKELDSGTNRDFSVTINTQYSEDEQECSCLLQMHKDVFQKRKNHKRKYHGSLFTRKAVDSLLNSTEKEHFKKYFPSPPDVPSSFIGYNDIMSIHNSIFFAGCYNKYSRSLSQTPWVIEGERKMESSVQEVICDAVQEACQADGSKFVASGREDVDVRMLGRGRPFACELVNPHRIFFTKEEVQSLENRINNFTKDVSIRDLQIIPKDELHHLKDGEESKQKRYSALCISDEFISSDLLDGLQRVSEVVLCQKTPIRVLHRRPLAVRNRTVYSMRAASMNNIVDSNNKFLFKLDIVVQAGTYIKEFVHGDFGRTKPNLGTLLGCANIDILALDVEEIMLDWPPPTSLN